MSNFMYIHPQALCESETVGPDTRIWAFAHVMKHAVVGAKCNIGEHAFVETGAVIGDGCTIKNGVMVWDKVEIEDSVFVGPGAIFTNDPNPRAFIKKPSMNFVKTIVRRGATIGAGAVIVCGVEIGHHAFVGAGAVVTKNVRPHALVVGNPAKQNGGRPWVCDCARVLRFVAENNWWRCPACKIEWQRIEEDLVRVL